MVIIIKLVISKARLPSPNACLTALVITFDSLIVLFEACYLPSYTRPSSLERTLRLGCKSLQLPPK